MVGHSSQKSKCIAIDARVIKANEMHGIARYTWELLKGLSDLSSPHHFVIFASSGSPLFEKSWPENFTLVEVSVRWISIKEQFVLPYLLWKHKVDLFHSPSFVVPIFAPCKMILTIHDLNHVVLPQYYSLVHRIYYQIFVRLGILRSAKILTVSEFSKKELMKYFKVPEEKVKVTYNGISKHFSPVEDRSLLKEVQSRYKLPETYILALSNSKPHKNIDKLVSAYAQSSIDIPLVLVGPRELSFLEEAEKRGKKDRLYFLPYVEENDFPAIYSLAKFFAFPSEYEGFGLPPLEALSCGVPVLANPSSCLPEVLGEHAFYVKPDSIESLKNGLESFLKELDEKEKKTLGRKYAQSFTWEQMVMKTLKVYEIS